MSAKIKTAEDVLVARDDLEFDVDAFLRRSGWKYSSDHPGSYWLWSKKIGKKTYHIPKDLALDMQRYLECLP